MASNPYHLMTPSEAEEVLGKRYFYRQRIYRMVENGRIAPFKLRGQVCYLGSHILKVFLKDLELKIASRFPQIDSPSIRVFYDMVQGKRIVVDGLLGKGISVNTDEENEDDLLRKVSHIYDWIQANSVETKLFSSDPLEATEGISVEGEKLISPEKQSLTTVLPEEISWIKVDTGIIQGIEVKSFILISLPSVAQFIGIRSDKFNEWITQTTFVNYILSAHPKHINDPEISVPWEKGVVKGYIPLIPFELIPEIIISFRQSGRTVTYPEKAKLLYELAKKTLEAVGLAISGNKDKAAQELAEVGKGLGLTVADQIIGIFKKYESRDYQIQTNKEFRSKIKEIGADYRITTGRLTVGITNRTAEMWKTFGASRNLPSHQRATSREVMRTLAPSDGVGMTFGERHFVKDPNMEEAIATGIQGKEFFERLKKVGLLDD